jgi:hypothetical protein
MSRDIESSPEDADTGFGVVTSLSKDKGDKDLLPQEASEDELARKKRFLETLIWSIQMTLCLVLLAVTLGLKISNFEAFEQQAKTKLFAHETAPPTTSPTFSTVNTAAASENIFS